MVDLSRDADLIFRLIHHFSGGLAVDESIAWGDLINNWQRKKTYNRNDYSYDDRFYHSLTLLLSIESKGIEITTAGLFFYNFCLLRFDFDNLDVVFDLSVDMADIASFMSDDRAGDRRHVGDFSVERICFS